MVFPDTLHKYHRNRLITLEITALSNRMFFFDLTVQYNIAIVKSKICQNEHILLIHEDIR